VGCRQSAVFCSLGLSPSWAGIDTEGVMGILHMDSYWLGTENPDFAALFLRCCAEILNQCGPIKGLTCTVKDGRAEFSWQGVRLPDLALADGQYTLTLTFPSDGQILLQTDLWGVVLAKYLAVLLDLARSREQADRNLVEDLVIRSKR